MSKAKACHRTKPTRPWRPWWLMIFVILLRIGGCLAIDAKDPMSGGRDDSILEDIVIVESTAHSLKFSLNATAEEYELLRVSCKSVKNLEEGFDDSESIVQEAEHICINLDACSTYLATLSIKTGTGDEIDKTVDAATDYAEPAVTILSIEPYIESINMTWTAVESTCISVYDVILKAGINTYKWSINDNKQTQLSMGGLNACQAHSIQFITYDVNSKFISNSTANSTTAYAEPGPITVSIAEYENAQVKVSWDLPQYDTCINYYYLKWSLRECPTTQQQSNLNSNDSVTPNVEVECEWSANVTNTNGVNQYIIKNVQGCDDYEFQMYVNNDSNAKSDPMPFTAPEKVPGVVTIDPPEIASTNITLHWSPPITNTKCVSIYQVHLRGPLQLGNEDLRQAEINTTSVLFSELDPCGQYNFTIVAVSLNGTAGGAVSSVFEALEARPSDVRNEVVSQEPYALNITWEAPEFATLCLNGYRLSAWDDQTIVVFDLVTNATSVRIESLYACQAYTVQIIAATKTTDGDPKSIETETTAIASQAPKFQTLSVFPTGLQLSAQTSDSDFLTNKCETIFAHFTCRVNADVPHKSAERYVEGVVGDISFKTLLSPLSPNTKYDCYASFFNIAGWSPATKIVPSTGPYFPDPPQTVRLKSSTNASLTFNWQEPTYANGPIKLYILHFQRVRVNYYRPPSCSGITRDPIMRDSGILEQSFSSLQPFTVYSIQVAAQNEYGVSEYTRPFMVSTESWIPDPVTNLKVATEGPYPTDTGYLAQVVVSWMAPCKSNGEINKFQLDFRGNRADYDTVQFQRSVLPDFNSDGIIVYNETDLLPEYLYVVSVLVVTENYTSSESLQEFIAPAGIPKKLNDTAVSKIKVDAFEASNPTYSVVVSFPADILEPSSGTIACVALLVSEKDCNPEPEQRYGALNVHQEWPDTPTWSQAYKDEACIQQYQTTPKLWNPIAQRSTNGDIIEYTIGMDICSNSGDSDYCNGPLKADTEYHLIVRLFTSSGYNDAALLDFRTDSAIRLTLILIGVCSSLFIALIAGLMYFWMAKRISAKRQSCHGIEDSLGDVMPKNFAIYYRDVSRPEKVSREFQELTLVAMDLSTAASELGYNKNRYADIFPYDKNRVILDIDTEGSDYINASFIDGYRHKKEYIATQGPKPESTLDFWRMILQHNVRIIVMVTQFREGDVVKCHEYFPFQSKGINVSVKKKETTELYDRTEMSVIHDVYSMRQKVVHFYFKKWPDHGCPYDPQHLITFVRKVKAERVPTYSPIVVHCSAGVGRTGTFIGLDIIMQRLKAEKKINIYETVKKLRFQRMKMVQTLTQYRFLYKSAYELVKHKDTRSTSTKGGKPKPKKTTNGSGGEKKVSFQDDPEMGVISIIEPASKQLRRNGSDLASVAEVQEEEVKTAQNGKHDFAMELDTMSRKDNWQLYDDVDYEKEL